MDRTAAAAFICPWSFISRTVPLRACNNMEQAGRFSGIYFPFFQQRYRQEVSVQDKQGVPEMLCRTKTITEHLYHMGDRFIPKPFTDHTVPIMDLDGKGEAERFASLSGQHSDGAKKVSVDKRGFGCAFRFLHHLFYAGHIPSIRSAFYSVTNEDCPSGYLLERGIPGNSLCPFGKNIIPVPGIRVEEMLHAVIQGRVQEQVSDYRSNAERIGTDHQSGYDSGKPFKCGLSGKTGAETQ